MAFHTWKGMENPYNSLPSLVSPGLSWSPCTCYFPSLECSLKTFSWLAPSWHSDSCTKATLLMRLSRPPCRIPSLPVFPLNRLHFLPVYICRVCLLLLEHKVQVGKDYFIHWYIPRPENNVQLKHGLMNGLMNGNSISFCSFLCIYLYLVVIIEKVSF